MFPEKELRGRTLGVYGDQPWMLTSMIVANNKRFVTIGGQAGVTSSLVLILILHGGEFMAMVQAIELKVVARVVQYLGRLKSFVIIGFKKIVVLGISAKFCVLRVL